ncbi:MAG TPA: DUF711 family protein [Chloroflexota bacterium]|jgi:uncharacterized protein (UPF0210 family)|nr:DUF711 family protein [Chloroflexota bacterium]
MIVRAVTLGIDLEWLPEPEMMARAAGALGALVRLLQEAGHEVQTSRVALAPYYERLPPDRAAALPRAAEEIEAELNGLGVGYVSFGPIRWRTLGDDLAAQYVPIVTDALIATSASFFSVEVADNSGIRYPAVQAAARMIREIADATEDGFGNLRLAAIANCPAGIPFFPAGYHDGHTWTLSIALQSADIVAEAVSGDDALMAGLGRVSSVFQAYEAELEQLIAPEARRLDIHYLGLDRSPAPFPTDQMSAAFMLERAGVGRFGEPGTLAAAMLLTAAIRGGGSGIGFSGLMLPLLEDSGLARRAGEGLYSWSELLLYSAVCGTGLDTVPLPGDSSEDELAGIVLDVAALSTALRKPLTARLFPVPGLAAGERTSFSFPYFANSVVLATREGGPEKLMRRALLAAQA